MQDRDFLAMYLNMKLQNMRSELGRSCNYLSYIKTKVKQASGDWVNVDGVKAVLLNSDGSRNKIEVILPVKLHELENEHFNEIVDYVRLKRV